MKFICSNSVAKLPFSSWKPVTKSPGANITSNCKIALLAPIVPVKVKVLETLVQLVVVLKVGLVALVTDPVPPALSLVEIPIDTLLLATELFI